MLDAKSLAVLQTLKSDIKASKPTFNGVVKGTGKKFGFVIADSGEEYFLPPQQMEKVFPNDEVTFTVVDSDNGKQQAELESLINSNFSIFNGLFQSRSNAQGVQPFNDAFSGWLFVAPKNINGSEPNDLVVAKVTRHPWETGKAQAEVIKTLGNAKNNRSWYKMALQDRGIAETFSADELAEADRLAQINIDDIADYEDLTHLAFVSIDGKTTLDVDDALYAASTDNGWILKVAIADVSAFVTENSTLFQTSLQRLTTTYLPGLTLPMLPEALSHGALSLLENEKRLALVFNLVVSTEGEVTDFSISKAKVKNHGKLNYEDVTRWIETDDYPEQHRERLKTLIAVTDALAIWRKNHANSMQNRSDYRIKVDQDFDVTHIVEEPKSKASSAVEEAMVATNAAIARWLKDDIALFMTHTGFRPGRESELKGLLRDYAPSVADVNGHDLDGFRAILNAASSVTGFPLLSVLQKRFERSKWSNQSSPHFGLGLAQYTNGTSPIRKFSDLLIHMVIKQKLAGEKVNINNEFVDTLNERGNASRQVSQTIENRLRLQWLSKQPEQVWQATIVHINAGGIVLQLSENGATGLLSLKKKKASLSYDPLRMQIKTDDAVYQLGDSFAVKILKCDESGLQLDFATTA